MKPAIAVVGLACRYPDAGNPLELWENVLARRQSFRRLPPERLNLEDYPAQDLDGIYATQAAVIEGYAFDRIQYRITGAAFRATDLTHWLALDIAAQALADAGFTEGQGLPKEATGVLVGNTLTGEFSRAALMRLRWPYVRRTLDERLRAEGWDAPRQHAFFEALEARYKAPFAEPNEETLAGGLSNTIAGRICNFFDFGGGGYTVDGACASSLLAVANACSALTAGDLDVALVGGVDLSLDPFELVGFSRVGALSRGAMRVYDQASSGFWPGEGCGFVVLMRQADALAMGARAYATLRGWGVSSDGSGGITRPEVEGQQLALQRAYRRAGYGPDSVVLFEGHGTGTPVGDDVELRALAAVRGAAQPAAIGSIKANIGHTKAAAGVAGLLKAVMAVHTQMLPPTTGCERPHSAFQNAARTLQPLETGRCWPEDRPLRAGVSSFGFGGINVHITLEGGVKSRRVALTACKRDKLAGYQDAELFLLGGQDASALKEQVARLMRYAARLSLGELTDLACVLARESGARTLRAALVATTPAELAQGLATLKAWLDEGDAPRLDPAAGIFLSQAEAPKVAFLFSGQASPVRLDGGALTRRFPDLQSIYEQAALPSAGDTVSTAIAEPAIVTAELAGLRALTRLGVNAQVAVGHSLGELTALHWAGVLSEGALLALARARGQAMAAAPGQGAMASLAADPQAAMALCRDMPGVTLAGVNAPRQCVIAGPLPDVEQVLQSAQRQGITATRLPVSHAFHSSLMAPAAQTLEEYLAGLPLGTLNGRVISTVTGTELTPETDLSKLLVDQLTRPVLFTEALAEALQTSELIIEVGPGHVLTGLVREQTDRPVVSLNAASSSLRDLLVALGAAYALGCPLNRDALFAGRLVRPLALDWRPRFFANPCEAAPPAESTQIESVRTPESLVAPPLEGPGAANDATDMPSATSALDVLRSLVAARAELPPEAVRDASRLLMDLHLNSISVGRVVAEASRALGLEAPISPTDYADATLGDIAAALEELRVAGGKARHAGDALPEGLDVWVRPFVRIYRERAVQPSVGQAVISLPG